VGDAQVVRVDRVVLRLHHSECAESLRVLGHRVLPDCKPLNPHHFLKHFSLIQNDPFLEVNGRLQLPAGHPPEMGIQK
jgi:hypothetical protein